MDTDITSTMNNSKNVRLGKVIISNTGTISGVVKNSRFDRVSDVSGSGESSSNGSLNVFRGNGYGNFSSRSTFQISTRIDIRHEFWVSSDDKENQFVFPTSIPIADGHNISITQLTIEPDNSEVQTLAFVFNNNSSKKQFIYFVETNSVVECSPSNTIDFYLKESIFCKAYENEDDFLTAHPEANDDWEKQRKETASESKLKAIKLFLLSIKYAPPIFAMFISWGQGTSKVLITTIIGLLAGQFLAYISLLLVSSTTGLGARALDNSKMKSKIINEHYEKILSSNLTKLMRA